MKSINPNLYPPGGWQFVDDDRVIHESESLDALANSLSDYRRRTGKPIGEPRKEIVEQLTRKFPQLEAR